MAIIRTKQERRFTTISNEVYADNQLSFQAMGLLSYLLSKPDNWSVSPSHLAKVTEGTKKKTGRDGVYNILNELKGKGYVETSKHSSGETDYYVFDNPQLNKPNPANTEQGSCSQNEPDPPKPTLINTDNKQILISNNNPPLISQGYSSAEIEILNHLNDKRTHLYKSLNLNVRSLRVVASNLKPIRSALKAKYTKEQMLLVIEHLMVRWGSDPSMRDYLNPQTIFRLTKLETKLIWAQEWVDNGKPAIGKPVARPSNIDWDDTSWAEGLNLEKC